MAKPDAIDWVIAAGAVAATYKTVKYVLGVRDDERAPLPVLQGVGRAAPTAKLHTVYTLEDRIEHIRTKIREADTSPEVWKLARETLSQKCGDDWCIPERDHEGEVIALFHAVRNAVRYTLDPRTVDTYASPKWTLRVKSGDCDDYVILLGSMLSSVGYPAKARAIQTVNTETWDHIYLLVGLPPERPSYWIPLDPSVPENPGWEVSASDVVRRRDFEV